MAEAFEKIANPGGEFNRVIGPTLASGATIAPTFGITPVSGSSAVLTITPPYAGFQGQLILLPTGAWTTATTTKAADNIAIAFTAVANVPVVAVYDGSLWYLK
jgi:hypothetical protein